MRVRVTVVLIALLGLTLGLTSCAPPAAPLPTAPGATAMPAPTTTVVVPSSWSVPVAPGASCPTAGPPATTFSQAQWDSFLANLAVQANLANPTHATLTGLRIEFPLGCYYVDSPVYLDGNHPLVDTVIDGRYTANPANSPQFVQTTVPDCATGTSMLTVQNPASWRLQLTGLTVQGSAPATPPYCGSDPGGIAVAGPAGSTGPHDVSVVGNSIHNTWGDNLYVGIVDHLLADGNTLRVAGRQSMSVAAGHDITVTHNTFEYADGLAFTIETNEGSDNVSRVLIDSNAASYSNAAGTDAGKLNGALWNATAAVGTTVSDVMFKNNTSKSALHHVGARGHELIRGGGDAPGRLRVEHHHQQRRHGLPLRRRQHHRHRQQGAERTGRGARQLDQQPGHDVRGHPDQEPHRGVRHGVGQHLRRRHGQHVALEGRQPQRHAHRLRVLDARLLTGGQAAPAGSLKDLGVQVPPTLQRTGVQRLGSRTFSPGQVAAQVARWSQQLDTYYRRGHVKVDGTIGANGGVGFTARYSAATGWTIQLIAC